MKATFVDGYSLRFSIEYIASTLTEANLVFGKDFIRLAESNITNTLHHTLFFSKSDIEYECEKEVVVGFSTTEFSRLLRSVGKRDQVVLSLENESLLVQVLSHHAEVNNMSYLRTKQVHVCEYDLPFYRWPNMLLNPTQFSKICTNVCVVKPVSVVFRCHEQGLVIQAIGTSESVLKQFKVGDCTTEEIVSHTMYPATVKSLTRIGKFAPYGSNVKLYFQPDMPVLVESKVGCFGNYSLLLRHEVLA